MPDEDYVRSFDNISEMFEFMRINEEAANDGLAPEQRRLSWGDYFVNFEVRAQVAIFGYCMTLDEATAGERDAMIRSGMDPDHDPEARGELAYNRETLAESHTRGYLFATCYSVIEPRGELGSTHRANAWPISKALYEAAQAANWEPNDMPLPAKIVLERTFQQVRAHHLSKGR